MGAGCVTLAAQIFGNERGIEIIEMIKAHNQQR
jgi:hypothetical protein